MLLKEEVVKESDIKKGNSPFKIIVEVDEIHGCKYYEVGQRWIIDNDEPLEMQPTPRGRGAEIHKLWPSPICAALLYDIYPKVLGMRYGGYWTWHRTWEDGDENGDYWRATCWDEDARVVVNIYRVLNSAGKGGDN